MKKQYQNNSLWFDTKFFPNTIGQGKSNVNTAIKNLIQFNKQIKGEW